MALLINGEQFKSESGIASNALVSVSGDFVCKDASGFATINTVGDSIEGIAHTAKTFAADNESSAKDVVVYASKDTGDIMRVEVVADAALTQANEGQAFDINSNGTVDVATAGAGTQLEMVKFVSQNKSIYKIL